MLKARNRGKPARKAEIHAELAELSDGLHPLFPHMAAEHYLDAAACNAEVGNLALARAHLNAAKDRVESSGRAGQHLLGRLFQLEAELRK